MKFRPTLWSAQAATLLVMSLGAADALAIGTYTITPLTNPAGTVDVYAKGANSSGQATGYVVDGSGLERAVRWDNGVPTVLPLPDGFTGSTAARINAVGQIVGDAYFALPSGGLERHAVLWQADGTPVDLGTIDGRQYSTAIDINDSGVIVGTGSAAAGQHALSWTVDANNVVSVTDHGSFGSTSNQQYAGFNAINNAGLKGGTAYRLFSPFKAMLEGDRGLVDISPSGQFSTGMVLAISDAGHIVGYQNFPSGSPHAAIFDGTGQATDLGTLYGLSDAWAQDVNSDGTIVGVSFGQDDEGNFLSYSFIHDGKTMYDLLTLLTNGDGWTELYEAAAITEDGLIYGTGTFNGEFRAYVVAPVPEATSLTLILPAAALLRRRR